MKERLIKLLELKSIITLLLVCTGVYGFVKGLVNNDVVVSWVAMVLVYYFQKDKNKE